MGIILAEKWVQDYTVFLGLLCLFGFAYGPLLYFYTLHTIFRDYQVRRIQLLHAIPFLTILVSALLGHGLCFKIGSLLYIGLIIYVTLSLRQILAYRQVVRNTRSTIDRINLSWLQWALIIFTVTLLTDIYSHFYGTIELIPDVSIVSISLLILINGVFYKGLKQPQIFLGVSLEDKQASISNLNSRPLEEFQEEADIILEYFAQNRPYTEPDLTLAELAGQLNMNTRRLSEVINRYFGQNFMDFINSYRIDYAKLRLKNPVDPKETIAEVMYDVGFNSKSSFYTIFKQKTGKTPSEFKRSAN